jgi:signal transduction histidine kinase
MRLSTRYFSAFALLATCGFVGFAVVNAIANYRENIEQITQVQQAEGRVIATRISAYLDTIALQLHEVDSLPWASGLLSLEDEREELHRLLKLNPAIFEIQSIGADGRQRNHVSRIEPDQIDSSLDYRERLRKVSLPTAYSAAYFREGSTPFVSLAVRESDPKSHLLIAEVSLRDVADLVASANVGSTGRAFVVDGSDNLVAHQNLSMVHKKLNLAGMTQVQLAHAATAQSGPISVFARSPESDQVVLTSAISIPSLQWTLFVEQSVAEVMGPVRASLYRTAGLLIVLLVVGLLVSRWLARRLTRPIVALRAGASKIGLGDLSVRVHTDAGDELGALAQEFNRMAQRLEQSYSSLEEKVKVRTQELGAASTQLHLQAAELASLNLQLGDQIKELEKKKEEAERANAAKTRFLAAASHDLRQPMQAISLLVEILREQVSHQDVGSLVDKVQLSVQALESLFVSLLDISRLDAGAVKPKRDEFPIANLLRLIEANFLPQALAKNLRLKVIRSRAVVSSDPALLERILGNLVSNAIRYTDRGRILVGCRRRGDHLDVLVSDTGSGISSEFHEAVFEEFFQVVSPARDRSKGLGLGLSIVKRTAEILGHPLIMRSEPGRGSTFGVRLPLVPRHETPIAHEQLTTPDRTRLGGAFVLVVDDDHANCFAIEAVCAQWGCHVVSGSSLETAIESLEAHLRSPDLIITDYRLGGQRTGLEVVEAIRRKREESIPAIVMTGDVSVLESDIRQQGRLVLLYKPINADKLWEAANVLLPLPVDAGRGRFIK